MAVRQKDCKKNTHRAWFLYNPPINKLFTEQIVNFFPIDHDLIEKWSKRTLPIDSKDKDEYLKVVRSIETPAKNMHHNSMLKQSWLYSILSGTRWKHF